MSNLYIIPPTHAALTCTLEEEPFAAVLEQHLNWSLSSPTSPLPWGAIEVLWLPQEASEVGAIPGPWTRLVCRHFGGGGSRGRTGMALSKCVLNPQILPAQPSPPCHGPWGGEGSKIGEKGDKKRWGAKNLGDGNKLNL